MIRRAGCLALLLIATTPALPLDPARPPEEVFVQSWTKRDGLRSNSVKEVEAAQDGYLWLGTETGLSRFDGVRFTHFEPARFPLLKGAAIEHLLRSGEHDLYIDTFGEVLRFDGEAVRKVTVRGRPGKGIGSITRDGQGKIWGTFDGGFGPVDGDELVPDEKGLADRPGGALTQLGVTPDGGTLVSSADRLFRIDAGRTTEVRWADGASVASGIQFSAPGGGVWIGNEFGAIGRLVGTVVHPIPELAQLAGRKLSFAYTEPGAGAVWIGVAPSSVLRVRVQADGAVVVDDFTKVVDAAGAEIESLTQDPTGALWIATDGRGLIRLSDAPVAMIDGRAGLPEAYYTGLFFDSARRPWLMSGAGLCDGSTRPIRCHGTEAGAPLVAAVVDPAGRTFVGTVGKGLFRFDDGRLAPAPADWSSFSPVVLSLRAGPDGSLFTTGYRGLTRIDAEGRATHTALPGDAGSTICSEHDRSGRIWLGTLRRGVFLLDGMTPRALTPPEAGETTVPALLAHGDLMLVGTMAGLQLWRDTSLVRTLTSAEGLGNDNVMNLTRHGDTLWIGHNAGVTSVALAAIDDFAAGRIDRVDGRVIGPDEGLVDGEVRSGSNSAAIAADGRIWFTTPSGFAIVDPRRVAERLPAPNPVIEEIVCDGARVGLRAAASGALALPAGTKQCRIEFTALRHPAPQRLSFRYAIDGGGWTEIGAQRSVVLTDLHAGRHAFQVAASGTGAGWSEPAAAFRFRVRPFFWQTWWFLGICGLALCASAYAAHRARLRRALVLERVRTRIASDLHDELGSSLARISVLSEVVRRQIPAEPASAAKAVGTIGETAREMIDATADIVWSIDPRRDDLQSVVNRVQGFAADLFATSDTAVTFDAPADAATISLGPSTRRAVFLFLKEALTNASRHARAHRIVVRLAADGRRLGVEVCDDGVGFDPAAVPAPRRGGHGLAGQRARAAELGGQVVAERRAEGGMTVRLELPSLR